MIRFLLLAVFVSGFAILRAQTISNPGFEDWSTTGFQDPVGWVSTNSFCALNQVPFNVTKSTDAHSGTAAVKCETISCNGINLHGLVSYHTTTTVTPDSISAWVKYTPAGNDLFRMTAEAFHDGEYIGIGVYTGGATNGEYIQIAVRIDYFSAEDADSIIISFISSEAAPQAGSVLLADDVSGVPPPVTVGLNELDQEAPFSLYPNPASESLNIEVAKDATIEIYNALGMLVQTIKADSDKPFVLSTSDYCSGVYLAKSGTGVTQRFVVKH